MRLPAEEEVEEGWLARHLFPISYYSLFPALPPHKLRMENADTKPKEEGEVSVPVMTQAEYTDKLETHQAFVLAKSAELTGLMDTLKVVRDSKEPLTQVKNTLQEEINTCNKAINAVSEEVTHLKQKLRYHNVKQIHDNIERLEYQLRNNNFKPREEQKILDEISMLQRSIRTLRDYEAKQAENKKYRAERTRLIEERNNNYSKIRALYAKEDEIKKEIAVVRGDLSTNRKSIDQLRQLRPKLEQEWRAQELKAQAARNKRYEEKRRLRQEQIRERQEEKRKLWEEYEASREPYEEEKNLCRLLINYLQTRVSGSTPTPSTPASTSSRNSESSTPSLTPATTPSQSPPQFPSNSKHTLTSPSRCTEMIPPESSGAFYCKPKDEEACSSSSKVNKRGKAKARKEQRLACRTKDIPHTPDVLQKFNKLSITPPRNTDQIPAVIMSLQDKLQYFHSLALSKTSSESTQIDRCVERNNKPKDAGKCSRPNSLPVISCSQPTHTPTLNTTITTTTVTTPTSTNLESSETKENGQVSPITPSSSSISLSSVVSPESIPAINVVPVSPGVSWPDKVIPKLVLNDAGASSSSSNSSSSSSSSSLPKTEAIYNGISSAMNGIQEMESLPELQKCSNGVLTTSNSDSYFSGPMSYNCNAAVDEAILKEPNNNGTFSYAAITAKVKPLEF